MPARERIVVLGGGAPPESDVRREAAALIRELTVLRADVAAEGAPPDDIHPVFRESARNLLHYLALRQRDLRPLQHRLAVLGLSSLGRAEPHVLATLDAVLRALHGLAGRAWTPPEGPSLSFDAGNRLLAEHAAAVLGPDPPERDVRIMVTMPSEAADDPALVGDLLARGMDVMRINGAHDEAERWSRMIGHLHRAEQALGREGRILMDLAGPKLRTGPLLPGAEVVKIRPHRDDRGRVVAPARVWLAAGSAPPRAADAVLPVPPEWGARLRPGERVGYTDARGKARQLTVTESTPDGAWADVMQTAYVVSGTVLRRDGGTPSEAAAVGRPPAREGVLLLECGDTLLLTRDLAPGRPAVRDDQGAVQAPARIGCTLSQVFDDVRAGEPIWFDDGKIGGVVEHIGAADVLVRIIHARPGGQKLRAGKGINLPESALRLPALTEDDLEILPFVARHADAVGLSFANRPGDVDALRERLLALTDTPPPIVVKIETRRAFEHLPSLLLAAMRAPACVHY